MAIKNDSEGQVLDRLAGRIKRPPFKSSKRSGERTGRRRSDSTVFSSIALPRSGDKLKEYANEKGIQIIGDVPIYVALDSSDAWANPEMLQFDEDYNPKAVAGCPPDAFSAIGQLWGNPLYDWKKLKKDRLWLVGSANEPQSETL